VRVVVRFIGRLGQGLYPCDPKKDLPIEVPDGASVKDLISHLKIPRSQSWMVVLDGRILKTDALLKHNACLYIVPAVFGG
jgi:sulfur carrier protein ThiS